MEILRLHSSLAVTQCNNSELTGGEQSIMLGKREADDTVEVEHLCQGQHVACESISGGCSLCEHVHQENVACESMYIRGLTHLGSTAGETDALLQGWTLPNAVLCGASQSCIFLL